MGPGYAYTFVYYQLGPSDSLSKAICDAYTFVYCRVYRVEGRILYEDRSSFWKEVKKVKRHSAKRATVLSTKPSAEAFVDFYRTLFSHHDCPSDVAHQAVSANVREYARSLHDLYSTFP